MKIEPTDALRQPPAMILYDWDNTLADSWRAVLAGMNAALRAHDMEDWTLEQMKKRARLSMRDSFPTIFGEDRWEAARDLFYAGFEAAHIRELKALDGAGALLETVAGRGIPQSVVSNKQGPFLRAEAAHLGWDPHFHALVGAGDAPKDKPNPEPVALAMRDTGIAQDAAVWFVGDAYVDIAIARNTGLTPILIHPDPHGEAEFDDHPPAAHFANLDAFASFLTGLST